ncbi:hypothetical protein HK096_008036 [Nowakowskiella sp. JEL0078]|nr:hypothetical protein HK096_008036 [Nowakowskiella sp. JEL0078]
MTTANSEFRKCDPNAYVGFPVSATFTGLMTSEYPALGNHARVVACQSPFCLPAEFVDTVWADCIPPTLMGHYFRALLQALFIDLGLYKIYPKVLTDFGIVRVKRLPQTAYTGFVTYSIAALKKLKIEEKIFIEQVNSYFQNLPEINGNIKLISSLEECLKLYESIKGGVREMKKVSLVYLTRAAIAPIIETVILADRLKFLEELDNGCNIVTDLINLFDIKDSPRNLVLIGIKRK